MLRLKLALERKLTEKRTVFKNDKGKEWGGQRRDSEMEEVPLREVVGGRRLRLDRHLHLSSIFDDLHSRNHLGQRSRHALHS